MANINVLFIYALSLIYCILFIFWPDSYTLLTYTEYGLVETLTALFYLITFSVCLYALFQRNKNKKALICFFLFFSLLCFLEETNWLQNYFFYSIESIQSLNSQNQVNIHNLKVFQGGSLLKSNLSFSIFLKSQNIFRIFFSTYFVFLPILYRINYKIKKSLDKINYLNPDNYFLFTLLINLILNLLLLFLIQGNKFEFQYAKSLAESRELLYSMYIFSYSFYLTDLKSFLKAKFINSD